MKVLVTGGAGFIGSHLAELLIKSRYEVIIYDNFSTGSWANIPKKSKVVEGDILDFKKLKNAMRGCKYVFHLAAVSSIEECNNHPVSSEAINYIGTKSVLQAVSSSKVKKVIFASSCAVYYEPNLYAETKYKSEEAIKNSCLDYVILRLFNIYGERQKNGVVSIFCCAACEDKKMFIHGDGSQTRDFVYVKDACKMFIKAMNPRYKKALWDVKTGRQTSVKQLAKMVKLETGIKKVVAHMREK